MKKKDFSHIKLFLPLLETFLAFELQPARHVTQEVKHCFSNLRVSLILSFVFILPALSLGNRSHGRRGRHGRWRRRPSSDPRQRPGLRSPGIAAQQLRTGRGQPAGFAGLSVGGGPGPQGTRGRPFRRRRPYEPEHGRGTGRAPDETGPGHERGKQKESESHL